MVCGLITVIVAWARSSWSHVTPVGGLFTFAHQVSSRLRRVSVPWATAVLVTGPADVNDMEHVKVHASPGSSLLLLLASPPVLITVPHVSSTMWTFDNGRLPVLVSV